MSTSTNQHTELKILHQRIGLVNVSNLHQRSHSINPSPQSTTDPETGAITKFSKLSLKRLRKQGAQSENDNPQEDNNHFSLKRSRSSSEERDNVNPHDGETW